MTITVNNKTHTIKDNATLLDVLNTLPINSFQGIAVAINQQIITQNKWKETPLQNNDNILLITATQGG